MLSFDADWKTNPAVARSLLVCGDALLDEGYVVGVELWDPAAGKGIDDILAARGERNSDYFEKVRDQMQAVVDGAGSTATGEATSKAVIPAGPATGGLPALLRGSTQPEWEPPIPFTDYPVPPFPVDALPGWMADYVRAETEATQTPSDLAAMLVLAVAGAGLAGNHRVKVWPGYEEPTNLFTVTALPPGHRKSAVFRDVVRPVLELEKDLQRDAAPVIAERQSELRVLKGRLEELEKKLSKERDPGERQALEQERKLAADESLAFDGVPAFPQLAADDVTPEKLASLLAEQGGRMLVAAPEGTILEIAKGRYSDGANLEVFLKGHAGDMLRVHRQGRPAAIIDEPALSLALAVQPEVLTGLAKAGVMRGRGFLARFLYALPASTVGRRAARPAPVPDVVAEKYHGWMKVLWGLEGGKGEDGRREPRVLTFSQEAAGLLTQFQEWLEPQMGPDGLLQGIADWALKLPGAAVRVAGVLHLAAGRPWHEPVASGTVAAGLRIAREHLLPHAQAAFGLMGADHRVLDAKYVLGRLEDLHRKSMEAEGDGALKPPTRRDVFNVTRTRFKEVEDLEPVLGLLQRRGYVRVQKQAKRSGPGRQPSPVVHLNPLYFQGA
jgi:hypothetical protein